jgi:2,3-bisphosphoglycerate-dependent phosphoglycerate mutase
MTKEDNNFCTIYLVRHGETEWNKEGIVMGQSDSPLTEKGIAQAEATAQELKDIHFDTIFSSDLHRTHRTAEIINLERQIAIQTSKALRERTFGHFEGTSYEEFEKRFQVLTNKVNQLTELEQKRFKYADDVESDEEVISRFITKLREIAIAFPAKTVLVVSHGGCIRTFLMHTGYVKYGELPPGSFANAGYVKVLSDGVDFVIKEVKGLGPNS